MVNKARSSFNLVEKVRQKRSRIKRFVRGFPRSATWIGAKIMARLAGGGDPEMRLMWFRLEQNGVRKR
jgi:hypothetical protein